MKLGKVLIYLIILVAVAAYLYLVEIKYKEKQESAEKESKKIVQLDKDKIVEIDLQSQDKGKIELKKPSDTWVLTAPVKAKADENAINALLASITDAQSEKVVLDKDVTWGEYGLDKPEFSVSIVTADKTTTVSFGAQNPAKTSYYLRAGDDPRLFLVTDTLKNALNKTVFDVRDKSVLGVAPAQVDRIVVTKDGTETELQRAPGDKWTMTKPEQIRVKNATIRQGLINLTNLAARRIIDEPQTEGDPYGLDKPQEKIVLLGKDLDQTLLVGKSEEKVGRPGSAPNRYVRVQGHDIVYLVDGQALKDIKTDPQELRDRALLTFKPLEIQKIELVLDGKKWLAVQSNDKKWTLEEPEKKQLTDAWPVTGILWDLKDLEWKSMTKPLPGDLAAVHLDKPRLVVSLLKKDDKEPIVLKAGWETVAPKKDVVEPQEAKPGPEANKQAELSEGEKKQGEKPEKAAGSPEASPTSATVNVIVEPHEEGSALFVVDHGFIERLRGDLKKLTEKK